MRNLKVWTFHPTSRNAILFMLLSVLFLVLQQSLQSGLPFMNTAFLKKVLLDEWPVLVFIIPALYSTFKQHRRAPKYFALYAMVVAFHSLEGLFLDFNKLVLLVLFFHVVIAYGFYQLLTWTYARAAFTPNFKADTLHIPMGKMINVEIKSGENLIQGRLTNWDEDGAFIWLEQKCPLPSSHVTVSINWEGYIFEAKGTIVSGTWDERGIGIEWRHSIIEIETGWKNLMAVFSDYGYDPRLLR